MDWRRYFCPAILLLVAFPLVDSTAFAENEYVPDALSKRMRAKAKSISLSSRAPDDCEIKAKFRGASQQFAQFRYGTPDSFRVIVVFDQVSDAPEDFDLYVDLNRDREITADEKVPGTGRTREIELAAQVMKAGLPTNAKRRILFRKSIDKGRFSIKTQGGYASTCEVDGKSLNVWRMDGNANGLFSDVEDELWIDLNGDGKWNLVGERFQYRSAIKIGEKRFAVRGNQIGSKIEFAEIEGEGKLSLKLNLAPDTKVDSIKASIFGDDGSAHSIESTQRIVLPVGKYMIGQISLKLQQADERPWHFSFSHSGNVTTQRWVEVTDSGDTVLEPFGDLDFSISSANDYEPGQRVSVRPRLKTGDNLYITGSGRGKVDRWSGVGGNEAKISATDSGQREFAVESTGFA